MTVFGALLSITVIFIFIPTGQLLVAAVLYGLCGLSDLLDGTMARITSTTSSWGAFLDSTLDRLVDASLLIALIIYFNRQDSTHTVEMVACFVSLVSGQAISYIRARAEALGVSASVGIAERAERSLIIWLALLVTGLGVDILKASTLVLAVISVVTVFQRVIHVRAQLKSVA